MKRLRELGLAPSGQAGQWNAITDVSGLEVGHRTLISGTDIRTGVTVILPQGRCLSIVPAASFALNGNGEVTGTAWIEESGFLEGPIALTNTCSVGLVRDTLRRWMLPYLDQPGALGAGLLPVVGETWDGLLNDIEGQHLQASHVFEALKAAASGPVSEGAVGGGTGMVCFGFKAGIGSSSRQVMAADENWDLGVLVQTNFGRREQCLMRGVPIGELIQDLKPELPAPPQQDGSIIAVLATNAPLLPHQLKRLARRMALGLARMGGMANNTSGDFFLAFSTASPQLNAQGLESWGVLANAQLDPLLEAAALATEEAILNAIWAGETMSGFGGNRIYGLPHDRVLKILQQRLTVD